MPSHPPDTAFYSNGANYTLWRDISRTFEDFCGEDSNKFAEKQKLFRQVLEDVLAQLDASELASHQNSVKEFEQRPMGT
jgi:hypothetical protein